MSFNSTASIIRTLGHLTVSIMAEQKHGNRHVLHPQANRKNMTTEKYRFFTFSQKLKKNTLLTRTYGQVVDEFKQSHTLHGNR